MTDLTDKIFASLGKPTPEQKKIDEMLKHVTDLLDTLKQHGLISGYESPRNVKNKWDGGFTQQVIIYGLYPEIRSRKASELTQSSQVKRLGDCSVFIFNQMGEKGRDVCVGRFVAAARTDAFNVADVPTTDQLPMRLETDDEINDFLSMIAICLNYEATEMPKRIITRWHYYAGGAHREDKNKPPEPLKSLIVDLLGKNPELQEYLPEDTDLGNIVHFDPHQQQKTGKPSGPR